MKRRVIPNRAVMRKTTFRLLCEVLKDTDISIKKIRNLSINMAEELFQDLQEADKEDKE